VLGFVVRRLLAIPPMLLLVSLFTFLMLKAAPGGPFDAERNLPPEIKKNVEDKFNLNAPWPEQYLSYVAGLVRLDLPSTKRPGLTVAEIIATSFPQSAHLGVMALCFALFFGVGAGLLSGVRQNTPWDYGAMSLAFVGISVPSFVIGPVLVLVFSLGLAWLPPARWQGVDTWILPTATLGLVEAAYLARLTRAGMLEVVRQDFIVTARAKGLSEATVIRRHALKGALLPVVTWLGPAVARLLTGTVVVESIFQVPGLGYYFVQTALDRDDPMTMGVVVFYSTVVMLLNLAVDVAYTWLDPRVRYA
jgi:oligopeptide transport system permease protein